MAEFVGNADVHQVALPPESRKNLAAILAEISGHDVDATHQALVAAELSEHDGLSYPMPAVELEVDDSAIAITPIHSPFGERAEKPEEVLDLIDRQHEAGKAVAMLFKASGNPGDDSYHWTMLSGHYDGHHETDEPEKGSYHEMDPSKEGAGHMSRHAALELINLSMQHMDVYVCTVEASPAS